MLLNERGQAIVGGRNEIAAFDIESGKLVWRERHTPPGRGLLRTVGAIAARAASLYFRYGGAATTAFRGAQAPEHDWKPALVRIGDARDDA